MVPQVPKQRPHPGVVPGGPPAAAGVGLGVGGRGAVVVVLVPLEDVDGGDLHVGEADAAGPLLPGGDGLVLRLGVGGVVGEVLGRHRRWGSELDRRRDREREDEAHWGLSEREMTD